MGLVLLRYAHEHYRLQGLVRGEGVVNGDDLIDLKVTAPRGDYLPVDKAVVYTKIIHKNMNLLS